MLGYIDTAMCRMVYLTRLLDDRTGASCGICDRCTGQKVGRDTTIELRVQAERFLLRRPLVIEPRHHGVPNEHRCEPGRALARWGSGGWGPMIQAGKHSGEFDDQLVDALADLVREWSPTPAPEWITAVPSLRHPKLVDSLAHRLADRLRLPHRPVVRKVSERPPQKTRENGAQQRANVRDAFAIDGDVLGSAVLLVDDLVDSRWTFAEVGKPSEPMARDPSTLLLSPPPQDVPDVVPLRNQSRGAAVDQSPGGGGRPAVHCTGVLVHGPAGRRSGDAARRQRVRSCGDRRVARGSRARPNPARRHDGVRLRAGAARRRRHRGALERRRPLPVEASATARLSLPSVPPGRRPDRLARWARARRRRVARRLGGDPWGGGCRCGCRGQRRVGGRQRVGAWCGSGGDEGGARSRWPCDRRTGRRHPEDRTQRRDPSSRSRRGPLHRQSVRSRRAVHVGHRDGPQQDRACDRHEHPRRRDHRGQRRHVGRREGIARPRLLRCLRVGRPWRTTRQCGAGAARCVLR